MGIAAAASRHSTTLLALGVVVGLMLPVAAQALRPALPACIAGLLVISMVRIPWSRVRSELARPGPVIALVAWLLVLCPVLTFFALRAVPVPAPLVVPIVLMAATPPLFSTPAMAFLWGLDAPLALVLVVTATLLGPFTLVAVAAVALDLDLGVEPVLLAARLAALVGGSFLLAMLVRRVAGPERLDRWSDSLNACCCSRSR
jgi:BASS family bile acid:Na+ symporter